MKENLVEISFSNSTENRWLTEVYINQSGSLFVCIIELREQHHPFKTIAYIYTQPALSYQKYDLFVLPMLY